MFIKNEQDLLKFIKYSPVVIILMMTLLINIYIYIQNEQNFKKDLDIYKKNYIESNKKLIMFQVEKVYKDIQRKRANLELELEKEIKARVQEALSIIKNLHKKYSHLPKEELINIIKETLRDIRFNENRGYFYLAEPNGKILLHPASPNYENKNISKEKNEDGIYFYTNVINHFKTNDKYIGYIKAIKPNAGKKKYDKFTYLEIYKPLNIIVGTGEYKDSFTKKIQDYIIKEHIQNVRYGKNGYIFIFDYDGYQLAHVKKEYIGKQRINLVDSSGFMITKEIIKQAKKGSGFISYIGSIMPETKKPAFKTTYIKGVEDWQWAIGSGFYNLDLLKYLEVKKEELRKMNNESLINTLTFSLILTTILISLAFYISNILKNFFNIYHTKINNQIKANRKKDMLLYQQSKMASMGEMLGNIAHQWRQPLSSISTIASGSKIQKELNILKEEEFIKGMDTIVSTTKHLSQTIDDFREFFNPDKTVKQVNTQDIYDKAIQLVSARLSTKEITLKSQVDKVTITTFENELLQALINILNNAIDAFENKTQKDKLISFLIKYEKQCKIPNCNMKECEQGKEGYLSILIQDNAGGIEEQNLNKIFDVYFTTKHKSQGTGIGLYMTYEIINKHLKGFISVENKKITYNNKEFLGAKFTIYLPIRN
ncbi:histidine kinase [Halarcobacter mediterraneus]|uniref:histidine kinase n=1 Tax=Halarcobacter mediterraneus TaxID=2023153 RepID=A0A4Q1AWZ2_9BACT|nr:cache domain-containing protein [Halarcobacter mediterraneus]RXK12641.1 histidine kinase [Halarcobacter mediterraneus]